MRADVFVYSGGYAKSRNAARILIESGAVIINGNTVTKPSEEIDENAEHTVEITKAEKFVSRGGLKLEAALEAFAIDVNDMDAIDIGASTGGFTDCLLKRGARFVVAVDSGEGQLDKVLACDKRVKSIEKYNARQLTDEIIPNKADIAVMDVSFISQTLIIPRIRSVLKDNGAFVSLIKPQFEAGRTAVGKGGVVKKAQDRLNAVLRVKDCAAEYGLSLTGLIVSPITGGDGNIEYLARFEAGKAPLDEKHIRRIVL